MRGLLSAWSHRGVTVASEDYRDDGAALIELTLDDADVRAPFLREAEAAGASMRVTQRFIMAKRLNLRMSSSGLSARLPHGEQSVGRDCQSWSTLPLGYAAETKH